MPEELWQVELDLTNCKHGALIRSAVVSAVKNCLVTRLIFFTKFSLWIVGRRLEEG